MPVEMEWKIDRSWMRLGFHQGLDYFEILLMVVWDFTMRVAVASDLLN